MIVLAYAVQGAKTLVVVGSPSIDHPSVCCKWVKWFKQEDGEHSTKQNLLHSFFLYRIRERVCLLLSCPCSYLFRLLLMRTWLTPTLKSRRLVNQWLNNGCIAVCIGCRLGVCMAVSIFLVRFSWFIQFSLQFQQSADGWSGAHANISYGVSISREKITIQPFAGQYMSILYSLLCLFVWWPEA